MAIKVEFPLLGKQKRLIQGRQEDLWSAGKPAGSKILVHLYWETWVGGGRYKKWSPGCFLEQVGAISDDFECLSGKKMLRRARFLGACAVTKSRTKNLKAPSRRAWKGRSFEYPKGGIGVMGRP